MSETDKRKPLLPQSAQRPRQILVQRNPVPTVNRMLSDAYETLGAQLGKFRQRAMSETFDVKDATAFNKLVTSLVTLQDTERKNTAMLELGKLTEAELEALAGQAAKLLGPGE